MTLTKGKILAAVLVALTMGGGGVALVHRAGAGEAGKPGSGPAVVQKADAGPAAEAKPGAPARTEGPDPDADQRHDDFVKAWLKAIQEKGQEKQAITDEEYLRRIWLDLLGHLPDPEEVRDFLADKRPDRRKKLVKALLERPDDFVTLLGWLRKLEKPAAARLLNEVVREAPEARQLTFSPDGKYLAFGGNKVRVVETATGKVVWEATTGYSLQGLSFSTDGKTLSATIRWDARTGQPEKAPPAAAAGPEASLRDLLKSDDPEVRRLAAALLARLGSKADRETLRHWLEKPTVPQQKPQQDPKAQPEKKPDQPKDADLEKKLERLTQELEELRRELRERKR
jgi:hypothetical protein